MTRIVEQQSGSDYGDTTQYTEEEKLEYTARWERFAKFIAGRTGARNGLVRRMPMIVTEISDPETVPNTFPGAAPGSMITRRNIVLETAMPGIEGLRFFTSSADNVQNEKTKLHALYVAVHGEVPPKWGRFSYDLDELLHQPVTGELTYKGTRDDGKRGGMRVNLTGIEMYDGEAEVSHPKLGQPVEEYQASATSANTVTTPTPPRVANDASVRIVAARNTASSTDEDEEEMPF